MVFVPADDTSFNLFFPHRVNKVYSDFFKFLPRFCRDRLLGKVTHAKF